MSSEEGPRIQIMQHRVGGDRQESLAGRVGFGSGHRHMSDPEIAIATKVGGWQGGTGPRKRNDLFGLSRHRPDVPANRSKRGPAPRRRGSHKQTWSLAGFSGELQPSCVAIVQIPRQHRPHRGDGTAPEGLVERPHRVAAVGDSTPNDSFGRDAATIAAGA